LLICAEKLEPMSLVRAYPIGVITMIDNGRYDEKIIAIPFNDPNNNQYKSISELPKHVFDEMTHFFRVYKNLENKDTAVDEVQDRDVAIKIISQAIDHYIDSFCK
jgi:inorganic pyrophosphatase